MKKLLAMLLLISMLLPVCGASAGQLEVVRPEYLAEFETATCGDVSTIPYPDNRDEKGFLLEGEFVHEDAENGLWAYLSPTVQVEIVRFTMVKPAQRWFLCDLRFDPEQEQFKQYVDITSSRPGKLANYGKTIAQANRLVIGINSDFYHYRVTNDRVVGNIIRNGEVLSNQTTKRGDWFPPLDTMALHNDGRITLYTKNETTADKILTQGDVHDALSFGPWLVRDGELRNYRDKNWDYRAPRAAMGMVEPGHYILLVVEAGLDGKKTGDGVSAKGFTIPQLETMMYAYGCDQAFNLDGGNTSQLIFMGEKLNRTGNMETGYINPPRTVNELFGVGRSEMVRTDWIKGKPKN